MDPGRSCCDSVGMLIARLGVVIAPGVVLATALGRPGGAPACYENLQRSCGDLHADRGRICINGANAIPCGDIVIQDNLVWDVKSGALVKGPIDIPYGDPVYVDVHLFECSGGGSTGNCESRGIHHLSCQGRYATGGPC
ncbi:MAG TPA: hypothetical protein VNN12_03415 [Dehalococcoidia bacterium]|nr:hypothetical protein [Dehalococcoidia bacterium]